MSEKIPGKCPNITCGSLNTFNYITVDNFENQSTLQRIYLRRKKEKGIHTEILMCKKCGVIWEEYYKYNTHKIIQKEDKINTNKIIDIIIERYSDAWEELANN